MSAVMIQRSVFLLACAAALAACDKPQIVEGSKPDAQASTGSVDGKYTAAGWSQGDKASWETQLRTRTQQGQNEYTRVPPKIAAATAAAPVAAPVVTAPAAVASAASK
jgi:hypothetical protein